MTAASVHSDTRTPVAAPVQPAPSDRPPMVPVRHTTRRLSQLAVAVAGVGATLIVLDGSWWWAVVRVVVVGTLAWQLMRLARSGSRRVTGIAIGAVGLVDLAAGVAVLASYLDTGWGVRVIGGFFAAGGGAAALALGVVSVVCSLHRWRRLIVVPAVVVLVYSVGFPVAVAVYATNVGRPHLGRATPADRGLSYIDVQFTTADGVTLSGWYIPSKNRAAVVVLHGASSTRSAVLDEAATLGRNGFGVLLYDARGMGRSGGRAMNFGWYGDRDIAAAIDYLSSRPDVDPTRIAAIGESMGGEEAIGAMAADTRLRAVVAEGATNRVAADWDWLPDRYGVRGRVQQGAQWVTYELTDLLTDASPPTALADAVAAAHRPVLLITAGNVADEANAAQHIQHSSPGTVQIWTVPHADHTGGLRAQPAEWQQRVTTFLRATLATSG